MDRSDDKGRGVNIADYQTGDTAAWVIVIIAVMLSFCVEITTEYMEILRRGTGNIRAEWLYEVTSHVAIVLAAMTIPPWLNRYPLNLTTWRRRLPIYVLGFLLFTGLHVFIMVGLRHLFWPLVSGGRYDFGLLTLEPWL